MKPQISMMRIAVMAVLFAAGCSDKKSTDPEPQPVSGKITATASGITGQNGSVFAVMAYDSDWFPGSEEPVIAGFMTNITSDDFSFTEALHSVDSQAQGGYNSEEKSFEPRTYSVVFYVAAPGNPPQHFAEVRIAVNGDVTAAAPAWSSWAHP
ncbi:hypothetical protein JW906_15230 [bacterium]|nr:hypothetical protein [bacterium]